MKKYLKISLLILLTLILANAKVYAYWMEDLSASASISNQITVGSFDIGFCNMENMLVIDEEFYNRYMELQPNGTYTWKLDEYGNIAYRQEVSNLTKVGVIIKSDICYEVISNNFNLINQGIPNVNNPLVWGIKPIVLNYIEGWAYSKNRVVKTENDEYFMARYYTTANPSVNRTGWDKIEPVEDADFNFYEGTTVPNYSSPILSNIERAYIWDSYTTYQVGDVVSYQNIEYVAIKASTNMYPTYNKWAWKEK